MRIVRKPYRPQTKYLGNVCLGQTFEYNGEVFVRNQWPEGLGHLGFFYRGDPGWFLIVTNLRTGELMSLSRDCRVVPINCEVREL